MLPRPRTNLAAGRGGAGPGAGAHVPVVFRHCRGPGGGQAKQGRARLVGGASKTARRRNRLPARGTYTSAAECHHALGWNGTCRHRPERRVEGSRSPPGRRRWPSRRRQLAYPSGIRPHLLEGGANVGRPRKKKRARLDQQLRLSSAGAAASASLRP